MNASFSATPPPRPPAATSLRNLLEPTSLRAVLPGTPSQLPALLAPPSSVHTAVDMPWKTPPPFLPRSSPTQADSAQSPSITGGSPIPALRVAAQHVSARSTSSGSNLDPTTEPFVRRARPQRCSLSTTETETAPSIYAARANNTAIVGAADTLAPSVANGGRNLATSRSNTFEDNSLNK
jgi:hypothetical protein